MHVQAVLEEEVESLAGLRCARRDGATGTRHGSNPGTVVLDGQPVPIRVPRVRSEQAEIPLRSYPALHRTGEADEALLRLVLYGLSCRNYESAARAIPGAIGLSSSTVSRSFVAASAAKLKEFQERDLKGEHYVALFLDGKRFADTLLVIALGVTAEGTKRFLGFVETDTEHDKVLAPLPAHAGRAPPRLLAGTAGGGRRRQGTALGGAERVPEEGAGAAAKSAAPRSTRGRPRTSGSVGWRPRCSTSNKGCGGSRGIAISRS